MASISALDLLLVTRVNLDIGIPDKAFLLGDEVISDIFGQLKFMPVLVLCARLCPPGVEGSLFAVLMSINNLSSDVSRLLGAAAAQAVGLTGDDLSQLWFLVALRSACKVTLPS